MVATNNFYKPLQAVGRHFRTKWSNFRALPAQTQAKRFGIGTLKVFNFACFAHLFVEYVGTLSHMAGPSMLPTIAASGDIVIEDRLSIRLNPYNISRGELIVLKSPLDPNRIICKRVLGLPGDIICVDPTGERAPSTEHVVIPRGHVWIMGDNAPMSLDSRTYGPVSMGLIQSKLLARIWPYKDFQIFRSNMSYID